MAEGIAFGKGVEDITGDANQLFLIMFTVAENSSSGASQSRWRVPGLSYFSTGITVILCTALALAMSSPTRVEELRRKSEEKREENSQEIAPTSGQETLSARQSGGDPHPILLGIAPQQIFQALLASPISLGVGFAVTPFVDLPFDPRPTWQSNSSPPLSLA